MITSESITENDSDDGNIEVNKSSCSSKKRKTDSSLIRAVQVHVGNVVVKANSSEELLTIEGSLDHLVN